jgi:hypothetical protein
VPCLKKEKKVNQGVMQGKVVDLQTEGLQILQLQQTGRTDKQQLFLLIKATDLALELQRNRTGLEDHVPIDAVSQTGKVHRNIRAQKLEVVVEGLPQQIRDGKNATQDRTGGTDSQLAINDEMKREKGIEKVVR